MARQLITPTSSFTRPADTTPYSSGDLVANSATAGSVVAPSFTGAKGYGGTSIIRRVRLRKSGTSVTSAAFRVHFFLADPTTVTNGDNGAFSVSGVADYLGAADVTIDQAFTDGAFGCDPANAGSEITVDLATGLKVYWLLEARAAYTPASAEVFTLQPEVWPS
jgi:hypothetical protein